MRKKLVKLAFFCIILFLLSTKNSFAVAVPCVGEACPTSFVQDILSKYKNILRVGTVPGISIPTVVSVPLVGVSDLNGIAVFEEQDNRFLQGQVVATGLPNPVVIANALAPDADIPSLHDKNYTTQLEVPTDGKPITTTLVYTTQSPITASELTISSAQYATPPTAVTVYAYDTKTNERKLVVYSANPFQENMLFPLTTARKWEVILNHYQPLRITEMNVVDAKEATTATLRFVAQPNFTYVLYLNPEEYVQLPIGESSANLISATNVKSLSGGAIMPNPLYKAADSDSDGVPNATDNCPTIKNSDQKRTDTSSPLGDACADFDQDGVANALDNCINIPNSDQSNVDGDKTGDLCDPEESRLTEKYPWIPLVGIAVGFGATFLIFATSIKKKNTTEEKTNSKNTP